MVAIAFYFIEIIRLPNQTIERLLNHRQFVLNRFATRIEKLGLQISDFCQPFIARELLRQRRIKADRFQAIAFCQQTIFDTFCRNILGI